MEPQKESNPNYLPYPPQSTDDEIDLRELLKALWKGKWIIIATTFVFAIGSVLYALSLPNIYKADVLLAPADTSNGGGLSKMAGQLGGLAALAGVNLGSSEISQADLAMQVIKSRQFVKGFINKHDLLAPLMAVKGWEPLSNRLIFNTDIYDQESKEWLRESKGLRGAKPSDQEAFEEFTKNIISISQDKDSGLYTISIKYYSPYLAKEWLDWLVEDINDVMRARSISQTTQNLSYLEEQLKKTSITDMRSTFYKIIEEQTKSLMLAEVQDEFVFNTIDPAIVPEIKFEPKRSIIVLLAVLIGLILGAIIVLLRKVFTY
ncbi:Wzz/FepE/Etk N-terminal domain-containing protein [Vibrio alginolyticus]